MSSESMMRNTWLSSVGPTTKVMPIRRLVRAVFTGKTPEPGSFSTDGVPWLTPGDISEASPTSSALRYIDKKVAKVQGLPLYPPGAILLVSIGNIGGVVQISEESTSNQQINALLPNMRISAEFLRYALIAARPALQAAAMSSLLPILNQSRLKDVFLPIPSLPEQDAVTVFLDRETADCDALVARYERLIELLEEKQVALITEVVTKGLDASAPLKDSGVSWFGKIPQHWKMQSLRRVIESSINGYAGDQVAEATGVTKPVTRIETISDGTVSLERLGWVVETPSLSRYKLKKGDILFSHINSLSMVGKCAIYSGSPELYVGVNLLRIRSNETLLPEYFYRLLSSTIVRQIVRSRAKPAINQLASIMQL